MSKTGHLRKLINEQLQTVQGGTYHKLAPADATYPYKVFFLTSVAFVSERDDQSLLVDIWDRSPGQQVIEEIADQIEALFHGAVLPRPPIYPAFFRDTRSNLEDPDKTLQHIQLRFLVQLHETEE